MESCCANISLLWQGCYAITIKWGLQYYTVGIIYYFHALSPKFKGWFDVDVGTPAPTYNFYSGRRKYFKCSPSIKSRSIVNILKCYLYMSMYAIL